MNARRGLALLVVAGVLGVLSALSLAFVTLSRLERAASQQRVHLSRALLLARSGVEDALARVCTGQPVTYAGENWDDDPGETMSGYEALQQVYQPASMDVGACPVRQAMRPSYFVRAAGNAAVTAVEGKDRGYSGTLGGSRLQYALKVEDESAKVNVNGGFLDLQDRDSDGVPDHRDADVRKLPAPPQDRGRGWNAQLSRVLDLLGAQPEVGVAALGTQILQKRPQGGYRSVAEVQALCGIPKDLSPWLTVSSWSDPSVVHPNAWPNQPACAAQSEVMMARRALALEEGGRPPVNLNAAARPVLASLLDGLQGTSWNYEQEPATWTIDAATAAKVASQIRQNAPFQTWSAFAAFLDALVPGVVNGPNPYGYSGNNVCRVDLIKANFDPNTALVKTLPDEAGWRWMDKSDLTVWSTEGSLFPTGAFRISCAGRVLSPDGRVLAQQEAAADLKAYDLLRQTSQKDFLAGRLPGSCLSSSTDPLLDTCGASASWNTWTPGTGLALLTYPAPPTAAAEDRDGSIALATVELDLGSVASFARFVHHLDDGWTAAKGSPAAPVSNPDNPSLQTDVTASVWPDPALSAPSNEPNTLRPDGAHLQLGRGIAFDAPGNFPPDPPVAGIPSFHLVVSYWSKVQRPHSDVHSIGFSCCRRTAGLTQFIGTGSQGLQGIWGVVLESKAVNPDSDYERQYHVYHEEGYALNVPLGGPRWTLATALLDDDETVVGVADTHMLAWNMLGKGTWDDKTSVYKTPFNASKEDLLAPGVPFVLGCSISEAPPAAAEVIDEFALCDLGDAGAPALTRATKWHDQRFTAGRYYKGNDGAFTSAILKHPSGAPCAVLRAWWTARLPSDPKLEADWFLFNGTEPAGKPRPLDPRLAASDVLVELLPPYAAPVALVQGGRVGLSVPDFRYRLTLRPNLADPLNEPALETPIFEDVTFACVPEGGCRVTAWSRP